MDRSLFFYFTFQSLWNTWDVLVSQLTDWGIFINWSCSWSTEKIYSFQEFIKSHKRWSMVWTMFRFVGLLSWKLPEKLLISILILSFSWWTMIKHLFWSLLGLAELDPLDSIDHTSVTIAHFLYGVFLVLGVILLVNMMIALLNNTYEKVQVKRTFLF